MTSCKVNLVHIFVGEFVWGRLSNPHPEERGRMLQQLFPSSRRGGRDGEEQKPSVSENLSPRAAPDRYWATAKARAWWWHSVSLFCSLILPLILSLLKEHSIVCCYSRSTISTIALMPCFYLRSFVSQTYFQNQA